MARTKTKATPYQPQIEILRKKQNELLDSFERDKAAGNALPDDGIQDLADKAANLECGAVNNTNFGGINPTIHYADDAIKGFGSRGCG